RIAAAQDTTRRVENCRPISGLMGKHVDEKIAMAGVLVSLSGIVGASIAGCDGTDACQSHLEHLKQKVRACGYSDEGIDFCEEGCWDPIGCSLECPHSCDP